MTSLTTTGSVLIVLGILAFAVPAFTTQQTTDVARIGDLKLQTTESTWHTIPPFVAGGALILGAVLLGVGFIQKR
jgi:hypothetical protein